METRWKSICLLLLLCLAASALHQCSAADDQNKDEFQAKLKEAEEAQEFRDDPPGAVESKIVKEAPKAELASGDGDVSTTGDCAGDIDTFCPTVKPGERRISDCLSKQFEEEEKGNVDGKVLSDGCKSELAAFKVDLGTNINKNLPLAAACAKDVSKLCSEVDATDPTAVLACLRDVRDKLSQRCQDEVFKSQEEAARDFRADAELHQYCQVDAEQLCADVKPGGGRVQDCLRDQRSSLSWECQEELFRQEVENADDLRLSVRLLNKCMQDKKTFCAGVKPGHNRAKECLEEHRDDPNFSAECKEEIEKMMERRATDFRLDASLRELCKKDIEDVCNYEKDSLDSVEGFDARVIQCLQDFRDELTTPECQDQVHKLTARASQDIRFDEPLADACYEDRLKLCEGVQPGSARVIRCLQDKREELSYECRAMLFDQEVRMAEDIDFKYPMKRSCVAEIGKFCAGIPHGHARIIRCLQDHVDDAEMSAECKEEVQRDEIRSNQDYRLNYRLNKACQADIESLCGDVCSPFQGQACGGSVLRCLTEKQDQIQSNDCQNEVFYFEKMEVNDFRNDVLLAEACRSDVEEFCHNVQPGQGRVIACLREHRDQLQDACRKEELKLNIIQSRDIRLRPKLNRLCSEEIAVYCKGVKPGKGRVFKCLQENLAKTDFGQPCKEQVEAREGRMQEDYRLDYGVSSQCENDVKSFCSAEQGKAHGNALVLKCLVTNYPKISEGCQREMSRAVRMALWEYKQGAALTDVCDEDVVNVCSKKAASPRSRGIWSIGAVGRCLSKQLAEDKPLRPPCRTLVAVAAPKDAQALFDSSMTAVAIAQRVQAIQEVAGVRLYNPYGHGASVITLSGWVALAAVAAIVIVTMGGLVFAYRRYVGIDKPYTMVMKQGDV